MYHNLASYTRTLSSSLIIYSLTGILQPIGTTDKPFTPPAPLQLEVELQPDDSELLNILSNITYEWQHNYTVLSDEVVKNRQENSGFMIKNNSLAIERTSLEDAGVYSVKIDSFGVLNVTSENCANAAFQVLRNYAIFNEVGFIVYNSKW